MDCKLLDEAVLTARRIMTEYYSNRDIYAVLDMISYDSTWIGPGGNEKKYSHAEMKEYFEQAKDSVPACEVADFDLHAVNLTEDHCMVVGSMTVRTIPGSELVLEVDQRVSFVFRFRDGKFEMVHLHNSNPYGEMANDEYFPHKIGSRSYQYLQRLLNEKTEVLDMITCNITGGLKGSNYDEDFSFFYVNEGLPRMLGYTYDEFMEKSGGSAAGAAYHVDRDAAKAECLRCFEKGDVYSAEYRMEKKDGSLIWVLDSGQRFTDSEGVTRVNSIITDITPLKQALFDLEIERERYRIALEHIVGAMCEYDVIEDVFTLYQRGDKEGDSSVKQSKIEGFSKKISSGEISSPEDGMAFLELCTGKRKGSFEFRTHLPYQDGLWHWVVFSCSVVFDHFGVPVRAIGMMKDVTEEKKRNLELVKQAQHDGLTKILNHTTVVEMIQEMMAQGCDGEAFKSALIMMDLDNFKEINDLNGHSYGDKVLIKTARILEAAIGENGIVGRIGGDEFLAFVKCADCFGIEGIVDEVLHGVREIGADKGVTTACSIGVAYLLEKDEEFVLFFDRADRAVYKAKDMGRNRAFIAID